MRRAANDAAVTALILLVMAAFAEAQTVPTAASVIERMQAAEKQMRDGQFAFTQEYLFSTINERQVLEGTLVFKQPSKIAYRQEKPEKQLIICDGKKAWAYNYRTKQVLVEAWDRWDGLKYYLPGMYKASGKMSALKKNFDFTLRNSNDPKYYLIAMTPKNPKKTAKYLPEGFDFSMWVDTSTLLPVKTKMVSRDLTCVTDTRDWKLNQDPPDELFKFEPPKDAEVFEQK